MQKKTIYKYFDFILKRNIYEFYICLLIKNKYTFILDYNGEFFVEDNKILIKNNEKLIL